jgi:predicted nucleic acid-binding protein
MNVVDSSGWLEYFADSPNAVHFAKAIEDVDNLIVPSACVYEVSKRIMQQRSEQSGSDVVGVMKQGKIVDLSLGIALQAAKLSIKYKLAMADAIILATARAYEATLWTQDAHFEHIEGVEYFEKIESE